MISTSLINHTNLNNIVSIITGVKITDEQKQFIEDNSINFSKFVRKQIDNLMESNK